MELNKIGSILVLIGGFFILLGSLSLLGFGFFIIIVVSQGTDFPLAGSLFGYLFVIFGIIELIMSILMFIGSGWMKQDKKCAKGSVMVLISSVVGGFNILGIVGGILGLVYLNEQKEKKK